MKLLDWMFLVMFTLQLMGALSISWWIVCTPLGIKVIQKSLKAYLIKKGFDKIDSYLKETG